jgi:hypothetical protein
MQNDPALRCLKQAAHRRYFLHSALQFIRNIGDGRADPHVKVKAYAVCAWRVSIAKLLGDVGPVTSVKKSPRTALSL